MRFISAWELHEVRFIFRMGKVRYGREFKVRGLLSRPTVLSAAQPGRVGE